MMITPVLRCGHRLAQFQCADLTLVGLINTTGSSDSPPYD